MEDSLTCADTHKHGYLALLSQFLLKIAKHMGSEGLTRLQIICCETQILD